jgi:hypothetical protein
MSVLSARDWVLTSEWVPPLLQLDQMPPQRLLSNVEFAQFNNTDFTSAYRNHKQILQEYRQAKIKFDAYVANHTSKTHAKLLTLYSDPKDVEWALGELQSTANFEAAFCSVVDRAIPGDGEDKEETRVKIGQELLDAIEFDQNAENSLAMKRYELHGKLKASEQSLSWAEYELSRAKYHLEKSRQVVKRPTFTLSLFSKYVMDHLEPLGVRLEWLFGTIGLDWNLAGAGALREIQADMEALNGDTLGGLLPYAKKVLSSIICVDACKTKTLGQVLQVLNWHNDLPLQVPWGKILNERPSFASHRLRQYRAHLTAIGALDLPDPSTLLAHYIRAVCVHLVWNAASRHAI